MKYYSTNKQAPLATLEEAVVKALPVTRGCIPERIVRLDEGTINNMKISLSTKSCTVAQAFR